MPELPEAETIARGLDRALRGSRVRGVRTSGMRLRRPVNRAQLRRDTVGKRVVGVGRRGKAVLLDFDFGTRVMFQLGMTGACRVAPACEPRARHEHVIFDLAGGSSLRFMDARRFGMVESFPVGDPCREPGFLRALGPEPFDRAFDWRYLMQRSRGRTRAVKDFLMDQSLVAGIGNIYASETLYLARVHPAREAGDLAESECRALVRQARAVLRAAIRAGGTTISDYRTVDGDTGRFARMLRVYGREGEPCPRCASAVARMRQAGRSTYFCPRCQR